MPFFFQIKGFPSNIETKEQLKDVLARIIFTPLQHHTVNYPVAYYGGFVPNMPAKLYDDPRAPKDVFSFHSLPQTQVATVRFAIFTQFNAKSHIYKNGHYVS